MHTKNTYPPFLESKKQAQPKGYVLLQQERQAIGWAEKLCQRYCRIPAPLKQILYCRYEQHIHETRQSGQPTTNLFIATINT